MIFSFAIFGMKKSRHRLASRLPRIIGVLLLAGTLAACSAVKTAYNQAPELAYWYLDGYADFTGAQSLQVKTGLTKLQAWHRQSQLPTYAEALQKWQQRVTANVTAAEACEVVADVRGKLLKVSGQVEVTAAAVASTLSPAQMQFMEAKFAKSNADFREEFIVGSADDRRSRRLKKAIKRAEMLYGTLHTEQLAVIAQTIDRSRFNPSLAFTEWQRRQQDVLKTVRSLSAAAGTPGAAESPEKSALAIRALIERTAESPDAAYRSYAKALSEQSCQGFAELHNKTTVVQRRKAVDNLKSYEQDFRLLAGAMAG